MSLRRLSFLLLALLTCPVAAEEPIKAVSSWQKIFREQAADYRFTLGEVREQEDKDQEDHARKVALAGEPILFWSQPVRGGDDGAVFLWTSGGRPVAIGTFFIWPPAEGGQAITHELQSLTPQAFTANWKERPWIAPADGVKYSALASPDAPAATPQRRLPQFKELARRFTAISRGRDDRDWELRLLPRPLYRYPSSKENEPGEKSEVLDGILFALVQGTDLEIVLLLEAAEVNKAPAWRWSAARMSDLPLSLQLDGKEVWQVEKAQYDQSRAAYYCGTVERYPEPPK